MMTIGEIGQIIALITAISISLYFGVKSLRQTRELQEKQYRLKLLDEIIEWGKDILKCGMVKTAWDASIAGRELELRPHGVTSWDSFIDQFDAIYCINDYIQVVASAFTKKPKLRDSVYEITRNLYNHLRLLELARRGKVGKRGVVSKHRTRLNDLARKLVIYATEIKTEYLI